MPRPSQAKQKRLDLLPVIARAFAELGYRRTTTAALAARCKVQENILYRLWPDKKAMFIASIDYVFDLSERIWESQLESKAKGSAAERLLAYLPDVPPIPEVRHESGGRPSLAKGSPDIDEHRFDRLGLRGPGDRGEHRPGTSASHRSRPAPHDVADRNTASGRPHRVNPPLRHAAVLSLGLFCKQSHTLSGELS